MLWADDFSFDSKAGLINPRNALIVYYDGQGPLNFNTLTPGSIPQNAILIGDVQGHSCQYGLSIPLGIPYYSSRSSSISGVRGNSSYQKLISSIKKTHPNLKGIYDVRMDKHTIQILGIFTKFCIEIKARGFE